LLKISDYYRVTAAKQRNTEGSLKFTSRTPVPTQFFYTSRGKEPSNPRSSFFALDQRSESPTSSSKHRPFSLLKRQRQPSPSLPSRVITLLPLQYWPGPRPTLETRPSPPQVKVISPNYFSQSNYRSVSSPLSSPHIGTCNPFVQSQIRTSSKKLPHPRAARSAYLDSGSFFSSQLVFFLERHESPFL